MAACLSKGSSLFLGIGTTPHQIADQLVFHTGLTVVTNNLNAALALLSLLDKPCQTWIPSCVPIGVWKYVQIVANGTGDAAVDMALPLRI